MSVVVMVVAGVVGWLVGALPWLSIIAYLQHPLSEIELWLASTAVPTLVYCVLVGMVRVTVYARGLSYLASALMGTASGLFFAGLMLILIRVSGMFPEGMTGGFGVVLICIASVIQGGVIMMLYDFLLRRTSNAATLTA